MHALTSWFGSLAAQVRCGPAVPLEPLPTRPGQKLWLRPEAFLAAIHGQELAAWAVRVSRRLQPPTNTVVPGGEASLDELLVQMGRGLLVESALGLGQGNVLSGAFSNTLGLAYVVEGGEVAGRVKDVSIAGNIYQDLKRIQALSREGAWVYGGTWLPYILLPGLNVVTKS